MKLCNKNLLMLAIWSILMSQQGWAAQEAAPFVLNNGGPAVNWSNNAGVEKIQDIIKDDMPFFLNNRSKLDFVVNYQYDGVIVYQSIPAKSTIPLGLYGKLNLDSRPIAITGKTYLGRIVTMMINDKSIHDQQSGETTGVNQLLEIFVDASAFMSPGKNWKPVIAMRNGYGYNIQDKQAIFPNLSTGILGYIGLGKSLMNSANDYDRAREILNLPTTFAENITVKRAKEVVETAAKLAMDVARSGLWVSRNAQTGIERVIDMAKITILDFIRRHGDLINGVEWVL